MFIKKYLHPNCHNLVFHDHFPPSLWPLELNGSYFASVPLRAL